MRTSYLVCFARFLLVVAGGSRGSGIRRKRVRQNDSAHHASSHG